MAALLASSVWKDKKDQLPALIASELNQQALCANSSGKIQIHENIIPVSFLTLVTMLQPFHVLAHFHAALGVKVQRRTACILHDVRTTNRCHQDALSRIKSNTVSCINTCYVG